MTYNKYIHDVLPQWSALDGDARALTGRYVRGKPELARYSVREMAMRWDGKLFR